MQNDVCVLKIKLLQRSREFSSSCKVFNGIGIYRVGFEFFFFIDFVDFVGFYYEILLKCE